MSIIKILDFIINNFISIVLIIISIIVLCFLIAYIVKKTLAFLNYYPQEIIKIDLTNKQRMNNDDLLDFYIFENGTEIFDKHIATIKIWEDKKTESLNGNENKIRKFRLRVQKNKHKAFHLIGIRVQTRYRQVNYQRHGYLVNTQSNDFFIPALEVTERIDFLKKHDFNVSYSQYDKIDQRKALTKQLKQTIKERDNYTCQLCKKHMSDEVGLHIDHIIPIIKGGKSIPSNLRVLCSKCNGSKGSKNITD